MMDEIGFHLSNQLETLQIQSSIATQHAEQLFTRCLTWTQRLFEQLSNGQYAQRIEDLGRRILGWLQMGWEQLQFHYYSMQFNPREFYQQIGNLFNNEVSKREVAFCLFGLTAGCLLGLTAGFNWQHSTRHLHNMKAIVCHHYIGIEGVAMIDDAEMPMIRKPNELLIQVKAASVNTIDAKICSGYSRAYRGLLNSGRQKDLPVIIGRDCAGVVIDIGQKVINFDIGDEVFLAVPSWAPGTMAEYLVVSDCQVAKRPKMVNFDAAASLPYSGCLAWDAIVNKSVIREGNARGKRVLIYGGTTPVGCILIQLVKLWGGHVVAVCKAHAIPVARALGADEVISFGDSDIEKELNLFDKFHAIFHTGGEPIDDWTLKHFLLPHGSYVSTVPEHLTSDSLGFFFGSIFSSCIRIKLLIHHVFGLNTNRWIEGSKISTANLDSLRQLVEADQLQTVVHKVYAPHHIEQALLETVNPNAVGSTIIRFQ